MMERLGRVIRKVRTDDHEAVSALVSAAFKRDDEAHLVQRLWAEGAVKFERLVELGGEVVGYCAFSAVTCKPELDGLLLGLGPVAVAPTHQGQGIGEAVIKEGLKVCEENGARLIAVLGEPGYYSRFGFEAAAKKKMSWAGFDAGDAFRIIDSGDIDTNEIRTIHYHPAFDDLS